VFRKVAYVCRGAASVSSPNENLFLLVNGKLPGHDQLVADIFNGPFIEAKLIP